MKRSLITAVAAFLLAGSMLAGGIVTNTNQSAMFTRMGNRTATLGIDAVYYNPAGLTKLGNGFHFSINNQTIGQTRTVVTDYSGVLNYRSPSNDGEFIGDVSAPIFPGVYGVFKMGNWAFSLGFNPVGGGGGATYESGLPSFEYPISDIPPALTAQGMDARAYRLNAFFEGSSVFYGLQANVAYALNDMISVAIGARYVMARESYTGYLNDIQIDMGGTWTDAPVVFNGIAATATGLATDATNAATAANGGSAAVQAEVAGGAALTDPLTNAVAIGTLTALGQDPAAIAAMDNQTAIGTLNALEAGYLDGAAQATAAAQEAGATALVTADQDVDATKEASGITPIVSINIQPIDMLNIAIKYEHVTQLEFTTAADANKQGLLGFNTDGSAKYLFADGSKSRLDMPAYLTVGATLSPIQSLLVAGHFGYFFDKNADWGGREDLLDANTYEIGLGAEYYLSDKFLVSAGWSYTKTSPTEAYQTDLSYTLPTHGLSAGIAWDVLPIMQLNLGGQYVIYEEGMNKFDHDFANQGVLMNVSETLQKSVWLIGVGVNITLASGSE